MSTPSVTPQADLARRLCQVLGRRVDTVPGTGPALLRSYDAQSGSGAPTEPALATTAFTYDNALAAIALVACGQAAAARRIGEALLAAAQGDRSGSPGRLRNAYRAGAQLERPVPPAGWWDTPSSRWFEDPHQVGSATGNVAWAALAMLTVAQATGEARFREGAALAAGWVLDTACSGCRPSDPAAPGGVAGGFSGGLHGYDAQAQRLAWKSTEHNADLVAVFDWLARPEGGENRAPAARWARAAAAARGFLDAMWDEVQGRFLVGTMADGVTPNHDNGGLDAQLWPALLPGAPRTWHRALAWAEREHGVPGGFDFDRDRDGLWVEGTAQAALAAQVAGRAASARQWIDEAGRHQSPGGYLWATREAAITTGLALGPASTTADFLYLRRPHLGATAWAAIAATGWNPFTGRAADAR